MILHFVGLVKQQKRLLEIKMIQQQENKIDNNNNIHSQQGITNLKSIEGFFFDDDDEDDDDNIDENED